MSKHVQVESALSMTGSNADERIPVTPRESVLMLAAFIMQIAAASGFSLVSAPPSVITDVIILVSELLEHQGEVPGCQRIQ